MATITSEPQDLEAEPAKMDEASAGAKSWAQHWGDAARAIAEAWGLYLAAMGVAAGGFAGVWAYFGQHGRLGAFAFIAVLAIPMALAFVTDTLPRLRERSRLDRLRREGISGEAVKPGYFRLRPYDRADHKGFKRADGAHRQVVDWVRRAKAPLLYLTGRSGTGKSSLLNAWALPELAPRDFRTAPGFHPVSARVFGDPTTALRDALKAQGVIWDRRPPKDTQLRAVLEKAAAKVAPHRLLLMLDQFEEFLILHKPEERTAMEALFRSLVDQPIEGLTILMVLRSDYIKELTKLDFPPLREDETWFEVGPFTRADTRDFLLGSKLRISAEMLESILDEAGEIEDNPGLIRPITANMLGVVLERFRGGLPKGTQPGSLLRDYLKEAISQPDIADHAPTILERMISDAGTKSPRSEPDLAQATSLDQALVRGCLVQLGRPGLVREIDPKARIWEVAHDFVARLLGQLVARAKPGLWTRLRPILAPASLAVWLLLLFGAYPAYHLYQYNATQRLLAREGVSIIQNDEGGHRLDYTNAREDAFVRFEPHLGPLAPINELDLVVRTNLNQLPSFDRRIDLRTLSIGVDTSQRRSGAQPKSQLTSLPPLDKLGALQSLEISSNDQLASIPALGAGRNLKELWIIENVSLEKIDGLDQLIVLETINLQSQNDELLTMAIEQLKGAPQLKRIALPFHAKAKGLGEVLNAKRRAAGREPVQVFYQ